MRSGDHTWPLSLAYHCCPKCGKIFESRKPFSYQLGQYVKQESCSFCGHRFELEKRGKPPIGPIFGEPQPPEMEWD